MDSPYARELQVAFETLTYSAKLSQRIIQNADKGVVEKDDLSPVTIADFAVQALLCSSFSAHFPDDGLIGEETASALRDDATLLGRVWKFLSELSLEVPVDSLCRLPTSPDHVCELIDRSGSGTPGGDTGGRAWVFDPIDGTKNYVKGEVYAINIGLLLNGRQVAGVVGCPNFDPDAEPPLHGKSLGQGVIVFAVKDFGAYARPLGSATPLKRLPSISKEGPTQGLRMVTCSPDHGVDSGSPELHLKIASSMPRREPDSHLLPWVLRWVSLAVGAADWTVWVYHDKGRTGKIMDHAGAVLLYQEVGGVVTDILGQELDFGAGRKMKANRGYLAAPSNTHAKLIPIVHQVLEDANMLEHLKPI